MLFELHVAASVGSPVKITFPSTISLVVQEDPFAAINVYVLSESAGGLEASPLSVVDSVYATSCRIAFSGEMADGGDYVCRVLAMHDEYEDSPYSDTCRVDMSATAISQVKSDNVPVVVEVYSLNGVLQATSLEAVKSLPKGVYVLRKGRETKKIVVD